MRPVGHECNALGTFCCGTFCCKQGQLCCTINSSVPTTNPQCADPVDGTCPTGM